MTAPGDDFGESAREEEGKRHPDGGASGQPDWTPPWEPPVPPPARHPPPPGYEQPPPGYEQLPGYGGPPYYPGPPQFGGPPAGYGPPMYPGGNPPSDYPALYRGGYGPQGAMQPGTNALAIGSLVSSFTGIFCCIGSMAAIVLGALAIGQIKRTRQEGYGLAVAGIVIGVATLVVTLIVAIFALHSQ
jgi:Domain of unknown function (DUF4190)